MSEVAESGELGDATTLAPWKVRYDPLYEAGKRIFDVTLAVIGLVLTAPVLLVAGALVKATSRGSVLFRQPRCGLGGRIFDCYKLRTMVAGAEELKPTIAELNEADGPVFKIRDDPRVTPVGRWLRRLSIDELPQLLNVLTGEMSVVGPRPPLPEEVAHYSARDRQRLAVKPGLTCLWQIMGRSEIGFREWVDLDLEYIRQRSFGYDLAIVLRTIPAVLSGRGAA